MPANDEVVLPVLKDGKPFKELVMTQAQYDELVRRSVESALRPRWTWRRFWNRMRRVFS